MPGTSPKLVATLRGIIAAVIAAALGAAITAVTDADWGDLAPYAPIALAVLRALEGFTFDAHQPPQVGALGGKEVAIGAHPYGHSTPEEHT